MTTTSTAGTRALWSSARHEADAYRHGEDRPLGGYVALVSAFAVSTGGMAVLARLRGKTFQAPSPWDFAMLTLATQRLSRLITKDPVTSPLRAPFADYQGTGGPGEVAEEVRGDGLRHSVGELLTCPLCVAQWVATGFALGYVWSPTVTRLVMTTMAAVGGADFLQHAYVLVQKAGEK
jgi:hypothetical protein